MNRRGFISSLGLGAAGLVATSDFDWERLLWRPKPIITVPAMPGKGTVRVWFDGAESHVFRNVDILAPRHLFIDSVERTRVLDRVECELPLSNWLSVETSVTKRLPMHERDERTILHAGNTLTFTFAGPLVVVH